jgi:hypothetical protein
MKNKLIFLIMPFIFVIFTSNVFAQKLDGYSEIELIDLYRYVTDAPIYPGDENTDVQVFTTYDLIKSIISIGQENGDQIKVFNNFGDNNPVNNLYISLIKDGDRQGFALIDPKNNQLVRDSNILVRFTCEVEESDLFGPMCYNAAFSESGRSLPIGEAIKNNPIFKRAIENSTLSSFSEGG